MCGIAGFTHKGWSPDRERIAAAVQTLWHRGPDQQGVFHSNICSMGATRLKIIDLVGGDQPIESDDGDTVIVFNGEVYDHMELRANSRREATGSIRAPTRKPCCTRSWSGTWSAFRA